MAAAARTILHDVEAFITRYVTLPELGMGRVLALWVLGTHCFQTFDAFPYLTITSATKRAGKTRLSEVLGFLANNARNFTAMTAFGLFRLIRDTSPTVFVDEAEALNSESASTIREVLNSGYRRGQTVPRVGPEGVEEWPTYCPKCFILIGDTYDTLRDRSILITLVRGTPAERFIYTPAHAEGVELRERLAAWAKDNAAAIRDAYARHPGLTYLTDRDEELWTPLAILNDLIDPAGHDAFVRIAVDLATLKTQPAVRYLKMRDAEEAAEAEEYAVRLLRDLLTVIDGRGHLYTRDALTKLHGLPTAPWRVFRGEGLTENMLADILARFHVAPRLIRSGSSRKPGSTVARGYRRADVARAVALLGSTPLHLG